MVSGTATDSLCPIGWELPENTLSDNRGWYKMLYAEYGLDSTDSVSSLATNILRDSNNKLLVAGHYTMGGSIEWFSGYGYYSSKTKFSQSGIFPLAFNVNSGVNPHYGNGSTVGNSIRCVKTIE